MYRVILSTKARRFYEKADASFQKKLDRCFDTLKETPRKHGNIKILHGKWKSYYRYRIGDWRVIYTVDEKGRVVVVAVISHRGGAYPL